MRVLPVGAAVLTLAATSLQAQQQVNQSVPSSASGAVEIVNTAGTIRVTGWERSEIRISGTLGRGVERLAVDGSGDRTTIRVVLPQGAGRDACSGRGACSADLQIQLPAGKSVTLRGVSSDLELQGVTGAVSATSTSGDVQVSGSPRQVSAVSTSGDVEVRANTRSVRAKTTSGDVSVAGTVEQSVSAESVSGDVEVSAQTPELEARSVSGDLEVRSVTRRATASTVSGSATINGSRMQYLSFESVSGNLQFEGDLESGAAFNVSSHSGDVELSLPAAVAADFQVTTFSGSISNGFGAQPSGENRSGPGKELRFSTGKGALIAVKTFSGDVRLRKR